ncbi:AMP-binding protein [Pantoea sp. Z09]|uniref:AMP-binding protein n=1 Tax=Pantoea sp. Z09 TaxID=2886821 RepID=UPI001EFC40DB|nr:AMP-binding protein [Pantoea sp. Z09]
MKILPVSLWLHAPEAEVAFRGDRPLMRSTLRRQVAALATRLAAAPGKRWALCFDDSYRFCVALLAAWYAGKTPVIPGHCRARPLEEMRAALDGVVSDMPLDITLPHLLWREDESSDALPPLPDDAALVLFTSGSTGVPRAVHKPLAVMERETQWLAERWGEQATACRFIASVSHQHLYGLSFRLFLPMALSRPFAAQQIVYSEQLTQLARHAPYAFISSPAFLRRLDAPLAAPPCALVISAGGALEEEAARSAQQALGCCVNEIYGSTETGVIAWRQRDGDAGDWRAFPAVHLEKTATDRWHVRSALIPDPGGWPLDDRLVMSAVGRFQLAGRHDRVVKIEEKRVSLSEVERRVMALPGVIDAAALTITRGGRCAVAVVVQLDAPPPAAELSRLKRGWRGQLHPWLEPVALPRYWRVVESIPVTSQSKRAWTQIEELFHVAG